MLFNFGKGSLSRPAHLEGQPFVLIGGVLFCMWILSQVLATMFGNLTLVMSFLLERFMLSLQISSVSCFICYPFLMFRTCSTMADLAETFLPCVGSVDLSPPCASVAMAAWLCSLHFTWGFMHPVRVGPHVWETDSVACGQAWTALTLLKPGLPTSRLWAHYSVAAGFFSSMACGLCEAELGPLIPRLGVSQGH